MEVVVGLDLHLKHTEGVGMAKDGTVIKQARFPTAREDLKGFLSGLPQGTHVTLESLGFKPLLANPVKAKQRASDVKTDKVDAEVLAHLTRMDWLPTCYVPSKEMRALRSFLRHCAADADNSRHRACDCIDALCGDMRHQAISCTREARALLRSCAESLPVR